MSATGFHPEPSAKAPWTRTIVLTAAYAGYDAAKVAPVRRVRIKRFTVHSANVVTVSIDVAGVRNNPRPATLASSQPENVEQFGMSQKNWDRAPIEAQSIDAPLSGAEFTTVSVAMLVPA